MSALLRAGAGIMLRLSNVTAAAPLAFDITGRQENQDPRTLPN